MPRHSNATQSTTTISFDRAIEAFVGGFCATRTFTHPYLAERLGNIWVIRDAPRQRSADYRREEWIAHNVPPEVVDAVARAGTRGGYCICAFCAEGEPDAPLRTAYKALGYRLGAIETFMAHHLRRIPRMPAPLPVQRVTTQDLADRLATAARKRMILPEHLAADSPIRQYVALRDGQPVGWARSVTVGDATWTSDVYVEPAYRRRGVGKSLLARLLRDDRARGARAAVLLASHAGAMLYPHVGYERIGRLLLLTPVRRKRGDS